VKQFTSCLGDGWRVVFARKTLRNFSKTIHDLNITIHAGDKTLRVWGKTLFVSGKNFLIGNSALLFYAKRFCLEPDTNSLKRHTFTLKQNTVAPARNAGISGKTLLFRHKTLRLEIQTIHLCVQNTKKSRIILKIFIFDQCCCRQGIDSRLIFRHARSEIGQWRPMATVEWFWYKRLGQMVFEFLTTDGHRWTRILRWCRGKSGGGPPQSKTWRRFGTAPENAKRLGGASPVEYEGDDYAGRHDGYSTGPALWHFGTGQPF
jgi:hypothetical protein